MTGGGEAAAGGESKFPGILMCVPCEQYVDADRDSEVTSCQHTWDEATDINHLDGEEWAKLRHDIYLKELESDEPRNRDMVFSEFQSLMFDLVMAEALPYDYDEREGLDKLLVSEP